MDSCEMCIDGLEKQISRCDNDIIDNQVVLDRNDVEVILEIGIAKLSHDWNACYDQTLYKRAIICV